MAKMSLGSWSYYDREVAQGRENYFLGRGEEAGRWMGSGAEMLGLDGTVDAAGLRRLFDEGRHPITGDGLGKRFTHVEGRTTVTGYSLSFSPPKSVSVLWALGGETAHRQVREAHDAAVATAVHFLETHAAFSRRGKAGVFQVDTNGFVAASFVHRTSRAGDPQLHTHVLVANKVRCADGTWRSLDGRELYAFQKPAGMLYNAALRSELTTRLGVSFAPVDRNGQADIVDVPTALLDRFSSRRRQVLRQGAERIESMEAERRRPLSPGERAEALQRAALEARPTKGPQAETNEELRTRWGAEAAASGHAPSDWLPRALGRDRGVRPEVETTDNQAIAVALARLIDEHAGFGRAEVVKVLAPLAPQPGNARDTREWIEKTSAALLADAEVVELAAPLFAETPAGLRRRDGLSEAERHGGKRFTTRTTLAREAEVLSFASRGREARTGSARPAHVDRLVDASDLSASQAAAVRRLCLGGETLACLIGPAGTGKTHAIATAARAWEDSGFVVRGTAVAAMAAGVLGTEARIPSDTLARLLGRLERSELVLGSRDVLVVDEAGMVTTGDLARLVALIRGSGAKVVLVGDDRQLPPVGAGGLFRLVVAEIGAAELGEVRRFAAEWERAASLRLRAGDTSVVDEYDAHGRVHGGSRAEMVEGAFTTWQQARERGESVVVVAPDHRTVDELAMRARQVRVEVAEVEPGGIDAGEQLIGVGDEVVSTHNDRSIRTTSRGWVRNGDRWRVASRSQDGSVVVVSESGRGSAHIPADYMADHLRLAYAVTVHKAQGMTVDRAVLVAGAGLTSELAYVGMTRGRLDNSVFVVVEDEGEHRVPAPSPLEVLRAALARPGAEPTATEVTRAELARLDDLSMLYALLEQARDARRGAITDRNERLAPLNAQLAVIERELDEARRATARARQHLERVSSGWRRFSPGKATARQEIAAASERADALERELARVRHQLVAQQHDAAALGTDREDAAWETAVRQRIAARTRELGEVALIERPRHLVELLGVPGADLRERTWAYAAGAIEAYRERWRVASHALPPTTGGAQAVEWRALERRLPHEVAERLGRHLAKRSLGAEW